MSARGTLRLNAAHPLNQGLVAWWLALPSYMQGGWLPMAGRYHGILRNGAAWAPSYGRLGGEASILFDGTDDYVITSGAAAPLTTTGPFSACCWGQLFATPASFHCLYSKGNQRGGGGADLFAFAADATPRIYIKTGAEGSGVEINVLTSNFTVWHHFGCTYDGTTWRGYLDGAAVSGGSAATPGQPACEITIGSGLNNSNNPTEYVNARIDDCRFWHRCLQAREFMEVYLLSKLGNPGVLRRPELSVADVLAAPPPPVPLRLTRFF